MQDPRRRRRGSFHTRAVLVLTAAVIASLLLFSLFTARAPPAAALPVSTLRAAAAPPEATTKPTQLGLGTSLSTAPEVSAATDDSQHVHDREAARKTTQRACETLHAVALASFLHGDTSEPSRLVPHWTLVGPLFSLLSALSGVKAIGLSGFKHYDVRVIAMFYLHAAAPRPIAPPAAPMGGGTAASHRPLPDMEAQQLLVHTLLLGRKMEDALLSVNRCERSPRATAHTKSWGIFSSQSLDVLILGSVQQARVFFSGPTDFVAKWCLVVDADAGDGEWASLVAEIPLLLAGSTWIHQPVFPNFGPRLILLRRPGAAREELFAGGGPPASSRAPLHTPAHQAGGTQGRSHGRGARGGVATDGARLAGETLQPVDAEAQNAPHFEEGGGPAPIGGSVDPEISFWDVKTEEELHARFRRDQHAARRHFESIEQQLRLQLMLHQHTRDKLLAMANTAGGLHIKHALSPSSREELERAMEAIRRISLELREVPLLEESLRAQRVSAFQNQLRQLQRLHEAGPHLEGLGLDQEDNDGAMSHFDAAAQETVPSCIQMLARFDFAYLCDGGSTFVPGTLKRAGILRAGVSSQNGVGTRISKPEQDAALRVLRAVLRAQMPISPFISWMTAIAAYGTPAPMATVTVIDCHTSLIAAAVIATALPQPRRSPQFGHIAVTNGAACGLGRFHNTLPTAGQTIRAVAAGAPDAPSDIVVLFAADAARFGAVGDHLRARHAIVMFGTAAGNGTAVARSMRFTNSTAWQVAFSSRVGIGLTVWMHRNT